MGFVKIEDKEINGVKITNIIMEAEYYFRTSGYNYEFYFHCPLEDEDEVYNLCKLAFPEGKNHVRFNGDISTYAVDHDRVQKLSPTNKNHIPFIEKGCNWAYFVREGNDD